MDELQESEPKPRRIVLIPTSGERPQIIDLITERIPDAAYLPLPSVVLPEDLKSVRHQISVRDFVLMVGPMSVRDERNVDWRMISSLFRTLEERGITVIPVMAWPSGWIDEFPWAYQSYWLNINSQHHINELVERIGLLASIDFDRLTARSFEELVGELLRRAYPKGILASNNLEEKGFDFQSTTLALDPLGYRVTENWLIECKHYRTARVSVALIEEITARLLTSSRGTRAMIITTGQVTSVARSRIAEVNLEGRRYVRIVESAELRRILFPHADLIRRFFGGDQ